MRTETKFGILVITFFIFFSLLMHGINMFSITEFCTFTEICILGTCKDFNLHEDNYNMAIMTYHVVVFFFTCALSFIATAYIFIKENKKNDRKTNP